MNAKLYPYNGNLLSAAAISRVTGIPPTTIRKRGDAGQPVDVTRRFGAAPKLYEFRGEMLTIHAVASRLGITSAATRKRVTGNRIAEGDELIDRYREPRSTAVVITHRGESHAVSDWAKITGVPRTAIYKRLEAGVSPALAISVPATSPTVRIRNSRVITRMGSGFRSTTGGYCPTFEPQPGTGGGSTKHDLQAGAGQ